MQLRTGYSLDGLLGPATCAIVDQGLLEDDGQRLRFSREGRFLADRVLCELV